MGVYPLSSGVVLFSCLPPLVVQDECSGFAGGVYPPVFFCQQDGWINREDLGKVRVVLEPVVPAQKRD